MKVDVNVVAWILFVNVLAVRISKQEKPEDCVPGKEFWSTFFHRKGTCAACPRYLNNCDDQGPDKEACRKSCAKQVSPSVIFSSTSTTSNFSSELAIVTSTSTMTMVASSTVLRPGKPTEHKEIRDDNESHSWIILLVLLVTALVFGSFVIVVLLLRRCRKKLQRNVVDRFGPCLRHPVQASPSELKIGGIQDSEGKQDSAIHLDETNC